MLRKRFLINLGLSGNEGMVQHIKSAATWTDLEFPQDIVIQLREFCNQVKQSGDKSKSGNAKKILFSGSNGSGKTKAAEVIANELGLVLYRINLDAMVNKYIGETEKNLSKLFDAAELSSAVLYFDEADALFGKRSEVKDSHDRYANMEVNYLLQRMEEYKGVIILATNLNASGGSGVDNAFLRRLHYIVEFPLSNSKENLNYKDNMPITTANDEILPRLGSREKHKMLSIRISDDIVLQLHPDSSILNESTSWTDFDESDPGITLLEIFAFLIENLLYRAKYGSFLSQSSLLQIHAKVRKLDEILPRLIAEQSKK